MQQQRIMPQVIWEEPRRLPPRQIMDSPAVCASCAMPTADESNHSAAGTLHPHNTDEQNDDGTYAYRASIASCNKNTPNSNLADI